jgi:hypothetical protein
MTRGTSKPILCSYCTVSTRSLNFSAKPGWLKCKINLEWREYSVHKIISKVPNPCVVGHDQPATRDCTVIRHRISPLQPIFDTCIYILYFKSTNTNIMYRFSILIHTYIDTYILSSSKMETIILRSMWICLFQTLNCPSSLFQSLFKSWS